MRLLANALELDGGETEITVGEARARERESGDEPIPFYSDGADDQPDRIRAWAEHQRRGRIEFGLWQDGTVLRPNARFCPANAQPRQVLALVANRGRRSRR